MLTLRTRSVTTSPWAGVSALGFLVVVVNLSLVAAISLGRERASVTILVGVGATVFGWPIVAALVRRPQLGILVLAALLPFHGLLVPAGLPGAFDAWKEVLVGLTLVATFLSPRAARAGSGRRLPGWAVPIAALLAISVLSAVAQHDLDGIVGLKVTFFYLAVALAIWRCPLNATERDRLVTILMATGVVTAAFGVVQQALGAERLASFGWAYNTNIRTSGGLLRAFSTFSTNFPFSLFLMLVLLIGLPVALTRPRRIRNRLFLLTTPVVLAGMVSALTRGGWVGLLVGLLYLGAVRFPALSSVTFRCLIVGAVALVFLAGYSASFLASESGQERVAILEKNFPTIAEHPFGLGIGATGSAAEKVAELQGRQTTTVQPDDYYLKIALELGVIGLWFFVLFLVSAFTAAHRRATVLQASDMAITYGTAAVVLAAAVTSLLATFFEVFPLDAYFWMLLAIVATCEPESR